MRLYPGVIFKSTKDAYYTYLKGLFFFNGLIPLLIFLPFDFAEVSNSKYFKWEEICKDILKT